MDCIREVVDVCQKKQGALWYDREDWSTGGQTAIDSHLLCVAGQEVSDPYEGGPFYALGLELHE